MLAGVIRFGTFGVSVVLWWRFRRGVDFRTLGAVPAAPDARMPPGSFEAGLRCSWNFGSSVGRPFCRRGGMSGGCGGFGTVFLPKWDEYPPPCRKFHKSFFVSGGRKSNLLPTKSGRSGRYSECYCYFC